MSVREVGGGGGGGGGGERERERESIVHAELFAMS